MSSLPKTHIESVTGKGDRSRAGAGQGNAKKKIALKAAKPYEFGSAIGKKFGEGTTQKLFTLSKITKQWEIGELDELTKRQRFLSGLCDSLRLTDPHTLDLSYVRARPSQYQDIQFTECCA